MEIYIVISRFKKNDYFDSVGVSQECYIDMEKAIEFCESRLNAEELQKNRELKKRNLINWFEFDSKNYSYEIKVLNVK